jgi:Arc/MetJ-type ribon-helix-helix transcriptional regulator
MNERKHTTITIPKPLFKEIKRKIKGTGFTSVSDFATFTLRELVYNIKKENGEIYSREESERIKDKLKKLGYI